MDVSHLYVVWEFYRQTRIEVLAQGGTCAETSMRVWRIENSGSKHLGTREKLGQTASLVASVSEGTYVDNTTWYLVGLSQVTRGAAAVVNWYIRSRSATIYHRHLIRPYTLSTYQQYKVGPTVLGTWYHLIEKGMMYNRYVTYLDLLCYRYCSTLQGTPSTYTIKTKPVACCVRRNVV